MDRKKFPVVEPAPDIDLDEASIAEKVLAERTRVFHNRSVTGALLSPLAILLLGWIQVNVAGWGNAAIWVGLATAIELTIAGIGYRYRLSVFRHEDARQWARAQISAAGFAGLVWGSSLWFLWADGRLDLYLAGLAILVSVAGISLVTMSPFRSASVLFSCGIFLPPLVQLALVNNPIGGYVAVGLVGLLVVQIGYARQLEQELFRELDNSVRNAALVKLLSQARGSLHKTNAKVTARNAELQLALGRLNEMVTQDQLTGAYSRRFIFAQLERQVSIKVRHGAPVCIIMFDLDHFKSINDRHGHPVGDRALQEVSRAVAAQLRDGDMLARIGGEEFLVLLPMTPRDSATLLAERLRVTLSSTFVSEGGDHIYLPASFGVAELGRGEDVGAWFRRVDAALYQAKAQGRNAMVTSCNPG